MPAIPEDLKGYIVEEDFVNVRSTVFLTLSKELVKVLFQRPLPLKFMPPPQKEVIDSISKKIPQKAIPKKNALKPIEWCPDSLEYREGKTTVTRFGAEGVISGPFSGCWFISFVWQNKVYAAHIGTGDAESIETVNAKTAFLEWTYENKIKSFRCFNPWKAYGEKEMEALSGVWSYLLGCITKTGECYSIFLKRFNPEMTKGVQALGKQENAPVVKLSSKEWEVMDVRICPKTSWAIVRANFMESMYKSCNNNRVLLSDERKNEIKKFHYGG